MRQVAAECRPVADGPDAKTAVNQRRYARNCEFKTLAFKIGKSQRLMSRKAGR
jgi:hypothetical protein